MSLDDFLRAARERADDGVDDGAATRLRIRESLAKPARASRKRFSVIAAVIASLVGSTAFAYWSGWRPSRLREAPVERHAPPPTEIANVQPNRPEPTPHVEPAPPVAPPTPLPARIEPEPPTVPVAPPTPRPHHVAPVAVSDAAPPITIREVAAPEAPTQPAADPELAAYGNAHTLHFRGGDPTAALTAWDAYLATYPNGKLALDARYNRALVLVKLQRWADARAALAPFANAAAGAYRQHEAAEILAAIRDR